MKPPISLQELEDLAHKHQKIQYDSTLKKIQLSRTIFKENPDWENLIDEFNNSLLTILSGRPQDLCQLEVTKRLFTIYNNAVSREKIKFYSRNKGKKLAKIKRRKSDVFSERCKYHPRYHIYRIFDYDKFSQNESSNGARSLSNSLGYTICPYCNIDRIASFVRKDGKSYRPDFDHYLPRATHPWFGISFYNLVPICSVCNSRIKMDMEFNLTTHTNPLVDDIDELTEFFLVEKNNGEDGFRFIPSSYEGKLKELLNLTLGIRGRKTSGADEIRAINFLTDMSVKQRYLNCSHEIADLVYKLKTYPSNRIKEIMNILGVDSSDQMLINECRRSIFGATGYDEDVHKRPLGKLYNDIVRWNFTP